MKRSAARGFTLIELMVAMVLGLIVVGGVISVMLANKRSYRTNEGLAQVQESARTAFELMARDIRQSAGNGCDNNNRTANLLGTGAWWQGWYGIRGFDGATANPDPAVADGTALNTRVAGTDSIHVQGLEDAGLAVLVHNAAANTIQVNAAATPFAQNDILLICDFDHATIFRATAYTAASRTVEHAAGGLAPGNCDSNLAFPALCSGAAAIYTFPVNSQISRVSAVNWYIGNNGRPDEGGRSLFRQRLTSGGTVITEEVVAGVTDLQIRYGSNATGSTSAASDSILIASDAALDWTAVNSIFIELTADSADTNVTTDAATNTGRIRRTFTYLISLRNRVE
jgi:type IV pilus assembly protein PilW